MRKLLAILLIFSATVLLAQSKPEPAKELPGVIAVTGTSEQASFQFGTDNTLNVCLPGYNVTIAEPAAIFGAYTFDGKTCGCIATNSDSPLGEPTLWLYWVDNSAVIYIPETGATYTTGNEALLNSVPEPFCRQVLRENHEIVTGQRASFTFRQ